MVQGLVDQSASRKRLKCQGVFMCTPLWRGTMAVYRFLAFALFFSPFLEMSLFPSSTNLYHYYRFLFIWRVRRTFSTSGWCFSTLLVTTGLIFENSLLCQNSTNQSIKRTYQKSPILSACPLHANSGCGKERRILIGPW